MKHKDKLKIILNEHVLYEYEMLKGFMVEDRSKISRFSNNALIESFAIHARNLIHFFYQSGSKKGPDKNDVLADHFFKDNSEWPKIRPPKSINLQKAKNRADKEVAHISYKRLKVAAEEKHWKVTEISQELDGVFKIFLENADQSLFSDQWHQILRDAQDDGESSQ